MLRDVDDRIALSESLKLPVEIPAQFAGDLAARFVAMPSMDVRGISGTLVLSGKPYVYLVTADEIFALTRLHEHWQSEDEVKGTFEMPARGVHPTETYILTFGPDDLKWLFFTVDKVISGADPVPLLGTILAELEVPIDP